ncbi:phosphatase PAP2 family protein [[Clostridium] aminophilum]|uniref:phosphatase PAP2 family protein n=1 Tax=[Clostridium] aminophilum TaxID=1526 RepID=UPI0026ED6C84|nr:phosphatase PAP2 family protein [[Clostridium] aminophilum]MDD6196099.1 phosphatase PAP2 family protein [[Clostridium] aminophilum]
MEILLKVILVQAILLMIQCVLYFGVEIFEGKPHNVLTRIDDYLPFSPFWVYAYVLWFPLIAVFPVLTFSANTAIYSVYITAILADIVISTLIYYVWPTSFERPVPPETFTGKLMKKVYEGSFRGVNCAPSMHCSMCYLVIIGCALCPELAIGVRLVSVLVAAAIVLSTMFTKQHAFVDAASALPLAAFCWLIGQRLPAQWLVNLVTA